MYNNSLAALFCLAIVCTDRAQAQTLINDTLLLTTAKKNIVAFYERSMDVQAVLYSGREYVEPRQTNDSHPFFAANDWQLGSVVYNGSRYERVPLLYDILTDYLVTEHFNGIPIVLVPEKVTGFTIESLVFERIENFNAGNSLPASGYYQIIYPGVTRIIKRITKDVRKKIEGNKAEVYYDEKHQYYLLKNGKYMRLKNKRTMLKILQDEKSALESFISEQKIEIVKANPYLAYTAIATYYDTLKSNRK